MMRRLATLLAVMLSSAWATPPEPGGAPKRRDPPSQGEPAPRAVAERALAPGPSAAECGLRRLLQAAAAGVADALDVRGRARAECRARTG